MNNKLFVSALCVLAISNGHSAAEAEFRYPVDKMELNSPINVQYGSWWDWFWGNKSKDDSNDDPFSLKKIEGLEARLRKRIAGQSHAINFTVATLRRYATGLNNPNAPIGSLLYVGPTGVGKTQLSKELARDLFGDEQALLRFDMSEQIDHQTAVANLFGVPSHYNGAREGLLSSAIKNNPYAIVLFDEIEKAHPNVRRALLTALDEGYFTEAYNNEVIDCHNVLFILTTNVASQKVLTMHDLGHSEAQVEKAIKQEMMSVLSPEFYARLNPVIFHGLKGETILKEVVTIMLNEIADNLKKNKKIQIDYDDKIIELALRYAGDYQSGARPLKQFVDQTVTSLIANALMDGYLTPGCTAYISYNDNGDAAASCFVLQSYLQEQPFLWEWDDAGDNGNGVNHPFKLENIVNLDGVLESRVLGQPGAIKTTVSALIRYAAGIRNSRAPIASFLYAGPSGVGKTQLAKELARELFGDEKLLLRLDMSEYSEQYSITRLIGSPPGYVNHEEGGQLTEALKKHPYSIVLLDEIEKAHPKVLQAFLQVFDEGHISDAQGNLVDCKNSIFILTTNLGSKKLLALQEKGKQDDEILTEIEKEITSYISPELYNRLETAIFRGLTPELLTQLVRNMLVEVQTDLLIQKNIRVEFDDSLVVFLKEHGYSYELGARPLKRLIQRTVVTPLSMAIVKGELKPGDAVKVFYEDGDIVLRIK